MGLGWICSYLGQNTEAADVFEGLLNRGMSFLDVLIALTSLPPALVNIDLLSELDKLVGEQSEDKAKFENTAAFVRAAALDKAGHHAEAWEHVVPANRTVFLTMQEELNDSSEIQRTILATLRPNPIKALHSRDGREPISLFILGPSRPPKTPL